VESKLYLEIAGESEYNRKYLAGGGAYQNGADKYYRSGLLKCLLLDEIAPGWRQAFDCSRTLDDLLMGATGG